MLPDRVSMDGSPNRRERFALFLDKLRPFSTPCAYCGEYNEKEHYATATRRDNLYLLPRVVSFCDDECVVSFVLSIAGKEEDNNA